MPAPERGLGLALPGRGSEGNGESRDPGGTTLEQAAKTHGKMGG